MNDTGGVAIGGVHDLGHVYLRRRYTILFYTLLFDYGGRPVFAALEFRGGLIELFLATNLLAAVMPVRAGKGR